MKYDIHTTFTCRVCGKAITCVFDEAQQIVVPKVEKRTTSYSSAKALINSEKPVKGFYEENIPSSVLIYLSCPDFHGPFAYQLSVQKEATNNEQNNVNAQALALAPPIPVPLPANGTADIVQPLSKITSIADDSFWLKYAKDSIEAARSVCDAGAQHLTRLLLWIWPIYTATFASTSLFFQSKISPATRIFLALPIPLIFLGYWAAQYSLLPVFTKHDPRIPYETRHQFNHIYRIKKKRLHIAAALCFSAVISVSLGLYYIRENAMDAKPSVAKKPPEKNISLTP